MKTLQKLTLVIVLIGFGSVAASAAALGIVSGGLTMTGVVDPTFNFLGLDFRGSVVLGTPGGDVVLEDTFASPSFGNTSLLAIDPVFDGTGAQVDFILPSFFLQSGGAIFNIFSTGTVLVGPVSAGVSNVLPPLLYTFLLTDAQPIAGTPNAQVTYLLAQVESTGTAVPEPASIGLGVIGLALISIGTRRRRATA